MSFLVWNCRGLANQRAVRFLKEIIQQIRPNLIFLSETFVTGKEIEKLCKTIHYSGWYAVDSQGHGGGLALLWKNDGEGVNIRGSSNHYIDFEVSCDQVGRWRYTGFYGCPERWRRRESWQLIKDLGAESQLPWCIIGDFNDMLYAHEKRGGRNHARVLLEGFQEVVHESGLSDLGYIGSEFTWERARGTDHWIQERLDRGFANQEWRHMFPQATVTVMEVSTSDHMPLFVELNKTRYVPKSKRFRFENMWIKEEQCMKLVQDS
ncbi:uncharacterized protein LOC141719994 [Apium graveolens]|uniref:uncharacterized protein LOC141719994 n=1 Tax=Apium graveolens TaxID=4045 RepID=UPI003D7A2EC4